MKKQVWIVGAILATALGGGALAQTVRVQPPNLTVAPASAIDVAALQTRLAQLEAAHNTTRTELAQTRLELQQTRAELNTSKTNLNSLRSAIFTFAVCERQRQGSVIGAEFAWVECPSNNNTPSSNLGNINRLQQATANAY